ncbi:3-dehydrosphinganine reductase TSC10A-like protein, partial [Drosera capensis]
MPGTGSASPPASMSRSSVRMLGIMGAVEEAGPVDVLVCNQGVFVPRELEGQGIEEVRETVEAVLPGMRMRRTRRERGPGAMAFVSSQAGQVGMSGYTAYSASRLGLRGLAEALQQEVISDDIHVSLIFPPDTDTPGSKTRSSYGHSLHPSAVFPPGSYSKFTKKKVKPQLTSIIAASSGAMKADEVAREAIDGIKGGQFIIPCNFEGLLLSIATAGLAPQPSYLMAFVEVVAAAPSSEKVITSIWSCFASERVTESGKKAKQRRIWRARREGGRFPQQWQPTQPGKEHLMDPIPQAISPDYRPFGKVARLTGGDSGIGRAVCLCFANEGATVAFTYLKNLEEKDADDTLRCCCMPRMRMPRILSPVAADLGYDRNSKRVVEEIVSHFGRIDILVNNAAEQHLTKSLEEITEERLERLVDKGIRVNGVAPGYVWTLLAAASLEENMAAGHGSDVPMKRPAQPHEIAP